MVDNETYTATLTELDSIANAAMTESEREMRAAGVVREVAIADLCQALALDGLAWNEGKASAFGVSVADWQKALEVAGLRECDSLRELLGVIHKAESAAAMLRAGYKPTLGEGGELSWTR